MSLDMPGGTPRRDKATTVRPGQVVRPHFAERCGHEVRTEGDRLFVTVSCPELDEATLRFAVGRRYVVLWTLAAPRTERHFIFLPRAVDPKRHAAEFHNGIFDLSVRLADAA